MTFIREEVDFEKEYSRADLRRFNCYETTLIVSYGRPFSQSDGNIPRLSYGTLGIKLSQFTRALHDKLITKRNKIFAHSDVGHVEYSKPFVMQGNDKEGAPFTVLGPPRFHEGLLLAENEIEQAGVLVLCLYSSVYHMLNAMHENFIAEFPSIDLDLP